jgi:integrase
MARHLTDAIVKRLKAPPKGSKLYYDDKVKGFAVRVTAAGSRSFVLNYYTKLGRERRYTIGSFPEWSTKAARDEAKALKRRIDGGADPVGENREAREAPTIADLCDRYLDWAKDNKRPSSIAGDEMAIRLYIRPHLGTRKLVEVTFDDVSKLHRKISDGDGRRRPNPIRANRVVALLSKMFNLASRWHQRRLPTGETVPLRTDNPARGITRNQETKRKRYLKSDELERLTAALATYKDQQAADIVRMLLLTGARSGEVLGARWAQFDLTSGVWTKPGSTTKTKTEHIVPLSAPARQLLSELFAAKATNAEYVFPGHAGHGRRVDLKKPWVGICKAAGITGLRVHDLRHSYASLLVSAGLSLPVIGALLGHSQVQTTQRYSHLLDDPLRKATETVGAIVTGKPKSDVMPLRGRG